MYQAKMNARDALKSDSALLYQGVANDYVYEDFVTEMDAGNMGMLDSINSMMNDSNGTLQHKI
ncbi:MAG: hypothetical protein IPP29_01820 [Bacteroidetes bacterium]|nr:hypothetical protein [Bacteroidota bacterium]